MKLEKLNILLIAKDTADMPFPSSKSHASSLNRPSILTFLLKPGLGVLRWLLFFQPHKRLLDMDDRQLNDLGLTSTQVGQDAHPHLWPHYRSAPGEHGL